MMVHSVVLSFVQRKRKCYYIGDKYRCSFCLLVVLVICMLSSMCKLQNWGSDFVTYIHADYSIFAIFGKMLHLV